MNPFPITQQITFLYTRDLKATADFYERILGFKLRIDQGACRIYEVTGDGWLGFCQREDAPKKPEGVIFTIVTPEVDAWHQALNAQGVAFVKSPALNEQYRIYHCFFYDPNGYLIEIQRFLD
jgi:catechol 2,3-dioxygenase-like lactoylglutathione lyase family enzyme